MRDRVRLTAMATVGSIGPVALAAALLLPATADAQTIANWTAGDGNWSVPGNWSTGTAPTSGDTANIQSPVTVTVDTAVPDPFAVQVSSTSSATTLQVSGGGTLTTNQATFGRISGDFGTLAVDGAGSTFTSTGPSSAMFMGQNGATGTVTVTNGGLVNTISLISTPTGTTNITVDGAGSEFRSSFPTFEGIVNVTVLDGGTANLGRLSINANSPTGQFTLNIGNGGAAGSVSSGGSVMTSRGGTMTVNFNHIGTTTFAPSLGEDGGTISLNKAGAGTTILTGRNSYTGGTTIDDGTLQLGTSTLASAIAGSVVNNAAFDIVNADTSHLGSIANNFLAQTTFYGSSSAASAGITNDGFLTFLETSTAGHAIIVSNFALGFGDSSTAGNATITNNSTLLFDQDSTAGNATIFNNCCLAFQGNATAGNAMIITNDGGETDFADTASGGQARFVTNAGGIVDISMLASAGTTAGSIEGAGAWYLGGKQLTVGSNNLSTTVSGVIADDGIAGGTGGSLVKVGTGRLNLAGINTYTGPTSVLDGTLAVNGSITSDVTVSAAGALGGNGTIFGSVANGGTLAPGNSIGLLTIAGNYTQATGSVYQVEVNAAGQGDRVDVGGTATIQGGTVQVLAQPGNYGRSTTYTILTAAGGVTGAYSGVTSNYAFLTPSLAYDPDNVYLTLLLQEDAFAGFGGNTRNQRAVGAVLDQVFAGATGDFASVLGAVAGLDTLQGPLALSALSGEPWADFGTMNTNNSTLFMNAIGQQMAAAHGGRPAGQRVALAEACDIAACESAGRLSAWASGLGGLGSAMGDGNAATLTYNYGGAAVGVDYRLDPRFLLGLGVGYTSGSLWVGGFTGQGWSDAVMAAAYGSFTEGAFYADAQAGYAYFNNRLQRQIAIPGLQPRTASGSTGANEVFGQLETGYRIGLYAPAAATLAPFARLQVASVMQNGSTEWGAESLDLAVAAQTTNALRTTFGADLAGAIALGKARTLDLRLRLGWQHEFADTGRPISAAFVAVPANGFTVWGAPARRDSAVVGLQVATQIADATELYLRYDGEIAGGTDNHALNLGLRVTW